MATATAMYYTGLNPLKRVSRDSEKVYIPKGGRQRRLHKAFLRYHDPANWSVLREGLTALGREDLIGPGKSRLVPSESASATLRSKRNKKSQEFRTQHTKKR